MSRTRRLVWLFSVLLTLGTLQATPAVRTTPFAEVRAAACLVLAEILGEESVAQQAGPPPAYPERTEPVDPGNVLRSRSWRTFLFRIQLPPPAPGKPRLLLVA